MRCTQAMPCLISIVTEMLDVNQGKYSHVKSGKTLLRSDIPNLETYT